MGAEISSMQQRIGSSTKPPPPLPTPVARRTGSVHSFDRKVVVGPPTAGQVHPLPPAAGQVLTFHTPAKWKAHFEASKTNQKLMVINFTASWCSPCQNMIPVISEFSTRYTDVEFVKIDVDELMNVAMEFGVQTMPTFILMKKGKIVDMVTGAKKEELRNKIDKNRNILYSKIMG
ncbi:thioredoxin H-type isoform X2 [Impatiens glandulifera]|uniref:thioredoxin H-type isoform X2 n=1 Tax=Impatiens glandulifera TaxID=253017 RepID=UPI001FB060E2|nr:thioredoxin H-type isoform X2 [Impatiens glandulifera]